MKCTPLARPGASVAFTVLTDNDTVLGQVWHENSRWHAEDIEGWGVPSPSDLGFRNRRDAIEALAAQMGKG